MEYITGTFCWHGDSHSLPVWNRFVVTFRRVEVSGVTDFSQLNGSEFHTTIFSHNGFTSDLSVENCNKQCSETTLHSLVFGSIVSLSNQ